MKIIKNFLIVFLISWFLFFCTSEKKKVLQRDTSSNNNSDCYQPIDENEKENLDKNKQNLQSILDGIESEEKNKLFYEELNLIEQEIRSIKKLPNSIIESFNNALIHKIAMKITKNKYKRYDDREVLKKILFINQIILSLEILKKYYDNNECLNICKKDSPVAKLSREIYFMILNHKNIHYINITAGYESDDNFDEENEDKDFKQEDLTGESDTEQENINDDDTKLKDLFEEKEDKDMEDASINDESQIEKEDKDMEDASINDESQIEKEDINNESEIEQENITDGVNKKKDLLKEEENMIDDSIEGEEEDSDTDIKNENDEINKEEVFNDKDQENLNTDMPDKNIIESDNEMEDDDFRKKDYTNDVQDEELYINFKNKLSLAPFLYKFGIMWTMGKIEKCSKSDFMILIKSYIINYQTKIFTREELENYKLNDDKINEFLTYIYKYHI